MWIKVALAVPVESGILTYRLADKFIEKLQIGMRVLVPLGHRKMIGVVVALENVAAPLQSGRFVEEIIDQKPIVTSIQIEMAQFISKYYAADFFKCLQLCLPPDFLKQQQQLYFLTAKGLRAQVFGLAMGLKAKDVTCLLSFDARQKRNLKDLKKDGFSKSRVSSLLEHDFLYLEHKQEPAKSRMQVKVRWLSDQNPIPGRSYALHEMDYWLRKRETSISMTELKFLFSGAAGKIKRLQSLGRVEVNTSIEKCQHTYLSDGSKERKFLSEEQDFAVREILFAMHGDDHKNFLLEGVTGSGKTEVYLRVLEEILKTGKNALFIVPEIGLTPLLYTRLRDFTGEEIAVLHSGLSLKERRNTQKLIADNAFRVILGARSALFAPIKNLGLIVIDEEHDSSFKQDENPRYHARDVALWLAKKLNIPCILGSATPSLESVYNVQLKKLNQLKLRTRVTNHALPKIEIIDLKQRKEDRKLWQKDAAQDLLPGMILSAPLKASLQENYSAGNQSLLFVNQRGYSSVLFCPDCAHIHMCPDCSISLTVHQKKRRMVCHQCDYNIAVALHCPTCSAQMMPLGLGTERVETEVQLLFPEARILRIDRDTMFKKQQMAHALKEISERKVDFIIGTQMLAKGHDFPGITLVGLVLADIALSTPDFRASERAFALITQVAGRAGRGDLRGKVLLQTYVPEHPAIVAAINYNLKLFHQQELQMRQELFFPPFSRALLIRLENENENVAQAMVTRVAFKLRAFYKECKKADSAYEKVEILGPSTAPIEKLRKRYRFQIFIICTSHRSRYQFIQALKADKSLESALKKGKTRLILDVDPINML